MATRATRSTKPAAAKTVVNNAEALNDAKHTEAAHEAFDNGNGAFAKFKAAAEEYCGTLPSGRRVIASWIIGLICAGGTGYLIGTLVSPILNALFVAIAVTTTSMFLAWIIYTLGLCAMLFAAWKAGGYVGQKVFGYVVEAKYAAHYTQAKSWVTGLFGEKTPITAC